MTTPQPNASPPPIDHGTVLENLPAFIAGVIPADERRPIDAHLATCPSCAAELAALKQLDHTLLSTLAPASPAGDFEDRLVQHFRETSMRSNHRFPLLRRLGLGVAAAIALGATGVLANHLVSQDLLSSSRSWPDRIRTAVDVRKIDVSTWFTQVREVSDRSYAAANGRLGRAVVDDYVDVIKGTTNEIDNGKMGVNQSRTLVHDKDADRIVASIRERQKSPVIDGYLADNFDRPDTTTNGALAFTGGKPSVRYEYQALGERDGRGRREEVREGTSREVLNAPHRAAERNKNIPYSDLLVYPEDWVELKEGRASNAQPGAVRRPVDLAEKNAITKSGSGAINVSVLAATGGTVINGTHTFSVNSPAGAEPAKASDVSGYGIEKADVSKSRHGGTAGHWYFDAQGKQAEIAARTSDIPAPPATRAATGGERTVGTAAVVQAARKIIRNGTVEYEVRSFDDASATVSKLTEEEGGYIASTNSDRLPNGKMRGTITLRCPPENLDRLVLKLRGIGELKAQQIGSSDVTKQYTDLESELRALRAMEERLIDLIKNGKGDVKALVEAESKLGEYRVKIEKIEGEIRYYNNLVGMATLIVTAYEKDIRQAAAAVETEAVTMSVETEDVEARYKDARKFITDAKGRIVESDLKRTDVEQLSARIVCEVPQDQADALTNQFRQLGRVARLDRDRRVTSDGTSTQPAKIETKDTRILLSMYNLANIPPRETTVINVAVPNVEELYRAVLAAVKKEVVTEKDGKPATPAGKVVSSSMSGQKPEQMSADVYAMLRTADADSVIAIVRGVQGGEVLTSSVSVNSDTSSTTADKRGLQLRIIAMASVQPREVVNLTAAATNVPETYAKLLATVQQMETAGNAQVLKTNLSEPSARNINATIDVNLRKPQRATIESMLAESGVDVMTRTIDRAEDNSARTESKISYRINLASAEAVPAVRTTTLSVEVNDVSAALQRVRDALARVNGREVDSTLARTAKGDEGATIKVEVPSIAGEELVSRLKSMGVEKIHRVERNANIPEGKLSRDRIEISFTKPIAPVQSTVSQSLSNAGDALLVSLHLLLFGIMFLGPWLLVIWIFWKLLRRRPKPAPATTA